MFIRTVDDKIQKLGFTKIKENEHEILYERYNDKNHYTQVVRISPKYTLKSYYREVDDTDTLVDPCIGLNCKEMKLFIKKMNQHIKYWERL